MPATRKCNHDEQGNLVSTLLRVLGAPVSTATNSESVEITNSDLPVLDSEAFRRTAAFLPGDVVAKYLQTLTERGESLLRRLHGPPAVRCKVEELVAAAHTLAGSAGMLGFRRVTAVGRRFEQAADCGSADVILISDELGAAIETMLGEIQDLMPRIAEAVPPA